MRCTRKNALVLVGAGGFIFFLCLMALLAFPSLYRQHVKQGLNLSNYSILYNVWKEWPFPTHQKIYYFNITNVDEFIQNGTKMKVQEVGPYTYRVKLSKEVFDRKNDTLSYREFKTYTFDPKHSAGSEDDVIYSINGPLFISVDYVVEMNDTMINDLVGILYDRVFTALVVKQTVRELGFDGYYDFILDYKTVFPHNSTIPKHPFGWFYGRNGTDDGYFKVGTGSSEFSDINVLKEWNGMKRLPYWRTNSCNKFQGGNGQLGPPFQLTQNTYSFFHPLFCRSLTFEYAGRGAEKGLYTRRFENTKDLFASPEDNPYNCCYQTKRKLPSGVQDIGPCHQDSPLLVSFPHFYLADEAYLLDVDGLSPSPDKHKSFVEIEPLSGITTNFILRYQMNIIINNNKDIIPSTFSLGNITSGVYPLYWVETETKVSSDFREKMKRELSEPKKVGYSLLGALMTVSGAILMGGFLLMYLSRNRMYKEVSPLLKDEKNGRNYFSINGEAGISGINTKNAISESKNPKTNNIVTGEDTSNDNLAVGIPKVRPPRVIKNEFHCNVKNCTIPSHHKISEKTISE